MTRTRYLAIVFGIACGSLLGSPVGHAQTPQTAPVVNAPAKSKAARTRTIVRPATPAGPVNLNTATVAQLQTLPKIGAAAAARIVDYRQKNGGFKKVEDLMNVKGIGEKTFLKLKPLVVVTNAPVSR